MPDHNTHGVGFKRMRMAGLLPAAALILAVFAPSTVSAAEVKLAGAVVSGLFYSKAESAEHSNLVLAGVGETPDDTCFKILGREDLGNGYYVRFNLSSNVTPDTGSFSGHNGLFSSSYMSIGNQQFEVTAGRMSGLTVSGDPYSVYAATDANMTYAQLAGIAPANITFQAGALTNAVAFTTHGSRFVVRGVYSNGDSNIGAIGDTEVTEDWSDRRHVAQLGAMWLGEKLKTAVVYSFEMPGQLANADGSRDVRRKNTHALHLIGSWHLAGKQGPGIAGILYASRNEWRIGAVPDLSTFVGDGRIGSSQEGLDNVAVHVSAKYPVGRHLFTAAAGYLHSKWNGKSTKSGYTEGSMVMGGVVYYYSLSKSTRCYAAASWADGRKLLDAAPRLNRVMGTVGLMKYF